MIVSGLGNGAAQYFWTRAIHLSPASAVVPFQYIQLVWAMLIGFAVWGDLPTVALLIGSAIVIALGPLPVLARDPQGAGRGRLNDDGTGAPVSSNPSRLRSAHSATGTRAVSAATLRVTSAGATAPMTSEDMAGWPSAKCIAATGKATPCDAQILSMRLTRSRISGGAGR